MLSASKYLAVVATAAPPALAAMSGSVSCPTDVPLSCHNSTVQDTCCFDFPGGQILQTQFWDTDPSTGPEDSWTIHGLWPDNCDGTYEQYCDPTREYTNITAILSAGAPCTLAYMQDFWKDYQGDDETFWEHEFGKHGTCMSTLDTACYPDYTPGAEVVDYFKRAVRVFKTLPSYSWLADAGIVPSTTQTYTLAAIQAALSAHHGHDVIVNCHGDEFNELWYHFNVRGSIQSGEYVAVEPVGSPSTCPATGIKYLPKYQSSPPPTTTTTPTTTTSAAPVPSGVLSGKGRLYVQTEGTSGSDGFMISGGKWYRAGGTPATYTATPNADGTTFSLNTSKGKCTVQSDTSLLCASSVADADASPFGYNGAYLTYDGLSTFFATDVPTGITQGTVYTSAKDVSLQITWTAT